METHTKHKFDVKWQALQDGHLGFLIFRDFDPQNFKNIFFVFEWIKMTIKSFFSIFKKNVLYVKHLANAHHISKFQIDTSIFDPKS